MCCLIKTTCGLFRANWSCSYRATQQIDFHSLLIMPCHLLPTLNVSVALICICYAVLAFFSFGNCGSFPFTFAQCITYHCSCVCLCRIDNCSAIYVGLFLKCIRQCTPWTRVTYSCYRLFDGFQSLTVWSIMCDVLHCLSISHRIQFRTWIWRYQFGSAPVYFREFCCSNSGLSTRRNVRSGSRGERVVPFSRISTTQHRTILVIGSCTWNNHPSDEHVL